MSSSVKLRLLLLPILVPILDLLLLSDPLKADNATCLSEVPINESKPCCLPEIWKVLFTVHSVVSENGASRLDYGAFRMRYRPDGTTPEALLVVGKSVASPDFCHPETQNTSTINKALCPDDRKICLQAPYLGEPRCLTKENGYQLERSQEMSYSGQLNQTWFIDRENKNNGYIVRNLYHVIREFGFCQLVRYDIQWGTYIRPRKTCRLFLLFEQTYKPLSKTYEVNFNHSLTSKLLFCNDP